MSCVYFPGLKNEVHIVSVFFLKLYDILLVPVESFLLFSYYLSVTLVSPF
jgi:hypothetical protein